MRCWWDSFIRAACVLLRSTGGPADHFRDEIFEACRGNTMMGLVHFRVRIQTWINHDPVDEIIHYGGDAVDTAQPLVKARQTLRGHRSLLNSRAGLVSSHSLKRVVSPLRISPV